MSDRRGFALILVVLLLFAIGVLGAVGYQMVQTEATMSLTDSHGNQALMAAQAGLERFMSEQNSPLPDEVTYTVQDARAVVVPTLLHNGPYPNQTWRITSVGTYLDPRFPGSFTERTVSQLAVFQRIPVNPLGALVSATASFPLSGVEEISGGDQASAIDCDIGGERDIIGVVGSSPPLLTGGTLANTSGFPQASDTIAGTLELMDSLDVAWDVLSDTGFPIEHENTWPNFSIFSMPLDSFPAIRYDGDLSVNCTNAGRGLLIVSGTLSISANPGGLSYLFQCVLRGYDRFDWDGLILAGDMTIPVDRDIRVEGILVEGLDGSGDVFEIQDGGDERFVFDSCNVLFASESVAHFEPLPGTWWEVR